MNRYGGFPPLSQFIQSTRSLDAGLQQLVPLLRFLGSSFVRMCRVLACFLLKQGMIPLKEWPTPHLPIEYAFRIKTSG